MPHSARRSPAVRQPVSACLVHVQRRGAAQSAEQILMGLGQRLCRPGEDRVDRTRADASPESSSHSSTASSRETRLRTDSVATAASRRGPKQLRASSSRSTARLRLPHSGQRTRCARCSVTLTLIGGSSSTWWRAGEPTATRSSVANTWPQRQRSGQCSTTPSTAHAGKSGRPWPSWPSWAPRLRPEGSLLRGSEDGESEFGGREELRELLFSSRSSFSTRASNCWIRRSIRSSTSTTTSRPASKIASASARSIPPGSTRQDYVPLTH